MEKIQDCVIIGGGAAGLSAALVLGRARRDVTLFDNSKPRNAVTHASHGFLTRDGVTPSEFRRIAYEEVLRYPSVEHRSDTVIAIRKAERGFQIFTEQGAALLSRKVLLASGLKETLPAIPGLKEMYGRSVFYCPYCDGWELRDQPLLVLSEHPRVFHLAKVLYKWSQDLVVCTNGSSIVTEEEKMTLASRGITVTEKRVAALHGNHGRLQQVEFTDGTRIHRTGGFITPQWQTHSAFGRELGCEENELGGIVTDGTGRSTVPGFFAAGEAATGSASQLILAAASGSLAAVTINTELMEEDFA
jgi:thioredoxin reductase